jgi:4-hydroxy-4-methyl-2-oxoglutarate aldolase
MDPAIQAVWKGAGICGPALPVECAAGDNLAIHLAVAECTGGEVLVVNAHAHLAGYWGEVLTVAALARGVAGLVIDGGVRDVEALERHRFPVFACGLSILRTVKHEPGRFGVPLVCGGVLVRRGDVVVADADGVVVVAQERVAEVLENSRARAAREQEIMTRLHEGELTLDLLGLRPS